MAERVGFEPTCRLPDKPLSRRSRYDHFGTSPQRLYHTAITRLPDTSHIADRLAIVYFRFAAKNSCISALLSAAHTPETIVSR